MKKFTLFLVFIISLLIVGLVGAYLGYRFTRPASDMRTEVSSQMILTALRDRGFLVTQTYIFDQPVTIQKTSGSAFKDFFFGQTITARGAMEVNMGVDLVDIKTEDITIEGDTININIPKSKIFNVRLVGPIDVENKQGILKRVIQNDDGYNEALAEMSKTSEASASDNRLIQIANDRAIEEIKLLIGYAAPSKTVNVTVKP